MGAEDDGVESEYVVGGSEVEFDGEFGDAIGILGCGGGVFAYRRFGPVHRRRWRR